MRVCDVVFSFCQMSCNCPLFLKIKKKLKKYIYQKKNPLTHVTMVKSWVTRWQHVSIYNSYQQSSGKQQLHDETVERMG